MKLDSDYTFFVGTYTDLDALAHQPYAPTSGAGVYTLNIAQDGSISDAGVTEVLNPAVLIPHRNQTMMYAIVETIRETGTIVQYAMNSIS
jgi:6-phosphogluconolactonase